MVGVEQKNSGYNMVGGRFGELTYVRTVGVKVYPSGQKAKIWELQCSCGELTTAPDRQIKSGLKQSCGHLKTRPRIKTHGGARGKNGTPEWRTWRAMRNRCNNPNDKYYKNYGGRGIKVCRRWQKSFLSFLQDMGEKPSPKHTIDRINTNGNYEASNCRWATPTEQARNRTNTAKFTYNGMTKPIKEWADELGCSYMKLYDRIRSKAVKNGDDAFKPFI